MNSYNENLQNTVAATLQNQNLDLKALKSQYKASMYTLYYAEGATITAEEKLDTANDDLRKKGTVKEQAVRNMNISANQLNSSTQAGQYNGQSVTNMATCASNVQIAATSIVRLAADIGSIFSIVNAADFGTDIYTLTDQVKELVNTTAYHAELTSQAAMEASAATSEVTASTVLNDAKATNALMSNILQIASADFNTASQMVATDNATLATVNSNEKLAEGAFKSADIDLATGRSAYDSLNFGLNLDLTAVPLASDSFMVFFDRLKTPFNPPTPPGISPDEVWYPVSDYYIFVVKESKQLTFSISEAENLRTNNRNEQFVNIKYLENLPTNEIALPTLDRIATIIDYTKMPGKNKPYTLQDSDGDLVAPGNKYVVFVMAVYLDKYKRLINNFDDFLSAPSLSFSMTTLLDQANDVFILPVGVMKDETKADANEKKEIDTLKTANVDIAKIVSGAEDAKYVMFFEATPPKDQKAKMGCQCIYLPINIKVPEAMMTRSVLDSFTNNQVVSDKIYLQNLNKILNECITELKKRVPKKADPKNDGDADKDAELLTSEIDAYIDLLNTKLNELAVDDTHTQTTFFFNKELAEIVPAGSYTPASPSPVTVDTKQLTANWWNAYINTATTDNFGNLLAADITYAPAVLTLSTSDDEKIISAYTNNISAYETVTPFQPKEI
jgi:hypothetical protein